MNITISTLNVYVHTPLTHSQFSSINKRIDKVSEQFNEAFALLESEIGETRAEVGRLSGVITDLTARIIDANAEGNTAAIAAAAEELNEVNAGLKALAPVEPPPVEPTA